MTLLQFTLGALLSLHQPAEADRARIEELGAAIASAVEERAIVADWLAPEAPLPFSGPRALEATILALAAIAWHESHFDERVIACRRNGDHGLSITAFQLMRGHGWGPYTRRELCYSQRLAAIRALDVLIHNGGRARTAAGVFANYSGNDGRESKASREICELWERLSRQAGIAASCRGRQAN